jgi:hypothetical protein
MKKLFIGTILVSLLGAAVIGTALAWTGSASDSESATAGQIHAYAYGFVGTGAKVVPTDSWIQVGSIGLHNDGDITLHATTGSSVGMISPNWCNLSGAVNVVNGGDVKVGEEYGGLYDIFLMMGSGANNACQNQPISYDLTLNFSG